MERVAEPHVKWIERPHFEYRAPIQVDFSAVYGYHIRIAVITSFVLVAYAFLSSWIQWIFNEFLEAAFLLSLTLIFGLIGTHAYHLAGEETGSNLHFLDPGVKQGDQLRMEKSSINEILSIFEESFHYMMSLSSSQRDDYRDMAWFIVISYSFVSLMISSVFRTGLSTVVISSILLGLVFAIVYTKSYFNYPPMELEERLAAIEYYVSATMKKLQDIESSLVGSPTVGWVQRNDDWLIYDFGYVFMLQPNNSMQGLYHLGFSKYSGETFRFRCTEPSDLANFQLSDEMRRAGWEINISDSDDYQQAFIYRESGAIDLTQSSKIPLDPRKINRDRLLLKDTIAELLSKCRSE